MFRPNGIYAVIFLPDSSVLNYEIQLGHLSSEEFLSYDPADEIAQAMGHSPDRFEANEEAKAAPDARFKEVLDRHGLQWSVMYASSNEIIFVPALWGRVFSNEWIAPQQLSEAIQNSCYFPKQRAEWANLWYWWQREDDEFKDDLKAVREKLKNHEYRSHDVIMHIFSTFISLVDDGIIDASKKSIFAEANNYLDTVVEKGLLFVPEEERRDRWSGFGSRGMQYASKGEDAEKLMGMVDDAINKMIVNQRKELVGTWLENLKSVDSQFLTDIGSGGGYYREPVFQYVDPDEFVKVLWALPNIQKYLVGSTCAKRYELYSQDLLEDLPFWLAVQNKLSKKLGEYKEPLSPSIYGLKRVSGDISKIIAILQEIAEQQEAKDNPE